MTETIRRISPVDGRVYAERAIAGDAEIAAAITAARAEAPRCRASTTKC
jgi:acyl-CoA reductase-like NAD-dependent aldehyde dehydrogenase